MLKKKYRLGGLANFKNTHLINSQFFSLRIAKNNLLYSRFRFIVSKRVDKRAVARNRLRRKFSECIEKMFGEIKGGYDVSFFIKKPALKETESLYSRIQEIFKKENFLI